MKDEEKDRRVNEIFNNAPLQYYNKPVQLKTVEYSELFPTASYLNCRISFGYSVTDNADPFEVLSMARQQAIQWHKQNFPQLYDAGTPVYQGEEFLPIIQKEEQKEVSLIDQINSCTEEKVLLTYRLIVKNNPAAEEAYNRKLYELQNALKD